MADHTAATPAKNKGNAAFKKKDYNGAIKAYSEAITIDGNWGVPYSNRSQSYFQLKKYDLALADALMCVKVAPDYVKGYHRGCNAYVKQQKFIEALALLNKAYKNGLRHNKDLSQMDDKVRVPAEKQQAQQVKLLPRLEQVKEKGNLHFKASEYLKAIKCYDEVIVGCKKRDPLSGSDKKLLLGAYCNKALCLQQQSDFKAVIATTSLALELDPYSVKALMRRSSAFEGIEKYRLALDDVRKVLLYAPSNTVANSAQHRLSNAVRALKKAKKCMR